MTTDRDRKHRIRARVEETGESYSIARMRLRSIEAGCTCLYDIGMRYHTAGCPIHLAGGGFRCPIKYEGADQCELEAGHEFREGGRKYHETKP